MIRPDRPTGSRSEIDFVDCSRLGTSARFSVSSLFTDEAGYYRSVCKEVGGHDAVNHTIREYVRGGATTNACENYFSILKRGLTGIYQHAAPPHVKRSVGEFDAATSPTTSPIVGLVSGKPPHKRLAIRKPKHRLLARPRKHNP